MLRGLEGNCEGGEEGVFQNMKCVTDPFHHGKDQPILIIVASLEDNVCVR